MRPDSRLVVVGLLAVPLMTLLAGSGVAAETMLYDVISIEFTASTGPMLTSRGPVRVEIIDDGPGAVPRWRGVGGPVGGLIIFDKHESGLSDQDAVVFGHHCAAIGDVLPHGAVARDVQNSIGGGFFAWFPSSAFSPDGVPDPYASFCLKATHQSTSAWSEQLVIGTRVRETQPLPPPAQQVTIALATNQTVSRSTPVKVSATGFAAGPLRYFISIDNTQKWFWNTSATTITQWWGTTAYPNGTHSVTVRVTDSAGRTATSTANVLVRN